MLSKVFRSTRRLAVQQRRLFSTSVTAQETDAPKQETSIEAHNSRVGADIVFSEQKHGYVLTFPWNFEEVISEFENDYKLMPESSYWHKFMVNTRSVVDFNVLFRKFHQACAIHDQQGLDDICEPKLASYVGESLDRIHFHGLDVEMANLTVEQPSIRVLKAEVSQGLQVDRSKNASSIKNYNVSNNSSPLGWSWKTYSPLTEKEDKRHFLDVLDTVNHRPYLVSLTCLIESPMKLYVLN